MMAALLSLISVLAPSSAPPGVVGRMAIGHGVCAAQFTAAGMPLQRAGVAESKQDRNWP